MDLVWEQTWSLGIERTEMKCGAGCPLTKRIQRWGELGDMGRHLMSCVKGYFGEAVKRG